MTDPYNLVCEYCNGDGLTFDATVHFSPRLQDWVINEKLEGVAPYCADCGGDTTAVVKHDPDIKVIKPPQPIARFATPENAKAMDDYVMNFNGSERTIAITCYMMTYNMMCEHIKETYHD